MRRRAQLAWLVAPTLACLVQEDPNFQRGDAGESSSATTTTDTQTGTGEEGTSTSGTDTTTTTGSGTTDTTDSGSTETGPEPTSHLIFVTSTIHTGMLGGRAGADQKCATRAAMATEPLPGTWVALISLPGDPAVDAIPITGPVYNMIGQEIAADANDLWNGSLAFPFRFDENGDQSGVRGWTGTLSNGEASPDHCNLWNAQQGGYQGILGNAASTTSTWVDDGTGGCAQSFHLFCIRVG